MVDGKYMAKAYANAATKETFEAQCLRDENGEIMTKTVKVITKTEIKRFFCKIRRKRGT